MLRSPQDGGDQAFQANFGGRGEALDKALFTSMKQGNQEIEVAKRPGE